MYYGIAVSTNIARASLYPDERSSETDACSAFEQAPTSLSLSCEILIRNDACVMHVGLSVCWGSFSEWGNFFFLLIPDGKGVLF